MNMKNVLFYITGHGYGHATRCIEILKAMVNENSDYFCHIKTNAPEWLFNLNLTKNYQYNYFFSDIGVAQQDWLTVDKQTTLAAFSELWLDKNMIKERETAYIREHKIELIFADIPPIAFEIAQAAHIPGIAFGNFSWDWIYKPYIQEFPAYATVIDAIQTAYAKATLLLRLPFHGDMSAFPRIEDVPLIGRKAKISQQQVRDALPFKIGQNQKMVIIALRPEDLKRIDLARLRKFENIKFLAFAKKKSEDGNLIWLPHDFLPYQELVNAADSVVSKLGYGIVSECIINQTPLVFTSRSDFAEYDVLRDGLLETGLGHFMPLKDFLSGEWNTYLEQSMPAGITKNPVKTNGVAVVLDKISEFLR